jgi:hypothetical protein
MRQRINLSAPATDDQPILCDPARRFALGAAKVKNQHAAREARNSNDCHGGPQGCAATPHKPVPFGRIDGAVTALDNLNEVQALCRGNGGQSRVFHAQCFFDLITRLVNMSKEPTTVKRYTSNDATMSRLRSKVNPGGIFGAANGPEGSAIVHCGRSSRCAPPISANATMFRCPL